MSWAFELCPQPPGWRVEWEAIRARFAWLAPLATTPQEPEYHAEGDALTHTRLVVEALAALDEWRALDAEARGVLLLAALLHDSAKPACTRVEPDGRIRSPGHARAGAHLARTLLWMGEGFASDGGAPPFHVREAVARLVRFHGLPLWFFEKEQPERAVIEASQSARLDWVALLAEADVRGRVCADQRELLDRVALFRAFCEEQRCYRQPRAFASDHARFVYFHTPHASPEYAAYDDTTFEVTLLSGVPGAGKDTWVQRHGQDAPVIALDALRRELRVAPDEDQGRVIAAARAQARELLRRRQPFIWNATNVTRTLRDPLIALFASYGARIRLVYLDAPYPTLLRRNRERAAPVPEAVLHKLMRRLDTPDLTEAQTVEWLAGE